MKFSLPEIITKSVALMEEKTHRSFLDLRAKMSPNEIIWSFVTVSLSLFCLLLIFSTQSPKLSHLVSPILGMITPLNHEKSGEKSHEVFGFAPYWTINKLDNVDYTTLTTLAYFGVPIDGDGSLETDDQGYTVFHSKKATAIFQKAHDNGTRVVLTLTMMDNDSIEQLLDSKAAQHQAISQAVAEVKKRGIDGVNLDAEYIGDPGESYQSSFSRFVSDLTKTMHKAVPGSRITVSVYASSAKGHKLYDIASIGNSADGIFMMAYDFAVAGSSQAVPTAPLYGYSQGKYSYDVATAVSDFLKYMPANKLIMGVPYYGYNYVISSNPQVKAETRPSWSWRGRSTAQTYEIATAEVPTQKSGWDPVGEVGWKAYYVKETGTWRMIFLDDEKSLALKYQFAKDKNLAGVGMWALGFDEGHDELWALLRREFGEKFADSRIRSRQIQEGI